MSTQSYISLYVIIAFITANLPWISERRFIFFSIKEKACKSFAFSMTEWFSFYILMAYLGIGIEKKLTGVVQSQNWQLIVVTLCLYLVFALPGFIYRYDIRKNY